MTNHMLKAILSQHIMPTWNGRKGRNPWDQTPSQITGPKTLVRNLLTAKTKLITTVPTSNKQYQPQVEVLWDTLYYTVSVTCKSDEIH